MRSLILAIGMILASHCSTPLYAQDSEPVQLVPGDELTNISNLVPGTRVYLRYFIDDDGNVEIIDYQTKSITVEGQLDDRKLRVDQRWQGKQGILELSSLVDAKTLTPLTHSRTRLTEDKTIAENFEYLGDRVTGMLADKEGKLSALDVASPGGTYNFEIDMETLATLPFSLGQAFEINFYHPGGSEPAFYTFKVAGETSIQAGPAAVPVWIVTTDYNSPGVLNRFFIAKENGTVMRSEIRLRDGRRMIKALITQD